MHNTFVRSGKSVLALLFSSTVALGLSAEVLDLTGVAETNLTTLAGFTEVKNDGDALCTLTVSPAADETFAGKITGNVRLVKDGEGFLKLTNADNSYTGGNRVTNGRLIAAEPTALGDTAKTIEVVSDCSQSMANVPKAGWSDPTRTSESNKITCVVFDKNATYAYPVHCSGWTKASIGGSGCGRQYNIVLTHAGTVLTGNLTCDTGSGVALHLGTLVIGVSGKASQSEGEGTASVNGDVTCPGGVVSFNAFGPTIAVNGCVVADKLAYDLGGSRPEIVTLGNSGNAIAVIEQDGSAANGRALTASAENALGGGVIYSLSSSTAKSPLIVLGASQTVTALMRNPNVTTAMPSPMTYETDYPQCHNVGTDAAATLTMTSGVDVVCDWWFKDGRPASKAGKLDGDATKPLSLVWAPVADCTLTTAGWAHPIHGSITVSRGTFVIDPNGTFKNVPAVYVAEGAKLTAGTDSFGPAVAFEIGTTSVLNVPTGTRVTMQSLKIGNTYASVGEHGDLPQVQGGGTVFVVTNPGAVEKDVSWTAGGVADTDMLTAENWEGGETPNLEDGVSTLHFAKNGSLATLTNAVSVNRLTFDGTGDFALAALPESDGLVRLGEGGVSNAVNGAARQVAVSVPLMPMQDQVWQMSTNVTLTVSGGLRQAPTDAAVTIRSSTYSDPTVTIRGSASQAAAEDENGFAGDVVAERTTIGTDRYGIPYLRLGGYAPLGLSGTLTVETIPSNQNNWGRDPCLFLSNAVVTKAISYTGNLYPGYIHTDTCSTNVIKGTITATSVCPTHFVLQRNSRLVFDGVQTYTFKNSLTTATAHFRIAGAEESKTKNAEVVFNAPFTLSGNANTKLSFVNYIKTIEFNASGNVTPRLEYTFSQTDTATISFGADFAFTNGVTKLLLPSYMVDDDKYRYATTYVDLRGHDQWFGSLRGGNWATYFRSTGGPATLHVTQVDEASTPFRGQVLEGVTFLKDGDKTLTFDRSTAGDGRRQVFLKGSHLVLAGGAVAFAASQTVPFEATREGGATVTFQGGSLDLGGQTAEVYKAYCADGNGDILPLRKGTYAAGQAGLPASVQIANGALKVLCSDVKTGVVLVVR